ncbi:MAG: phage portal protein [Bifidobacterium sp.]|jgi:hypothetical protein|nr:phage portal protein [Bifidobacterium sp.]MCI1864465.1 phage portal protein [Bifidobacterium sp.]
MATTNVTATGKSFLAIESVSLNAVRGVDADDIPVIQELLKVWANKYPHNLIRSQYVDAHYRFKDFGISIPDKIKSNVDAMIGWPAKAVRSLADLSVFEGFSFGGGADQHGVADLCDDNALDVVVPEAISSAYTHSCAFLTVSADENDRSRMVILPRSADWSAAIWDRKNNRISSALTITSDDENGSITGFNVWLPNCLYTCAKTGTGWEAVRSQSNFGRPTIVPLCYDAQLNRPFGRSRVSRPLMSLTDIGFRTIVRMEASAEFYAVPKLWFLGANKDAFSKDTWSSLISAINAISKDEDGDNPQLQQIQQASMQPHSDMLKTIALMVSSETSIPVSDLGIITQNPTSAEAMSVAERKLTREADRQNIRFGRAIKDAVTMAVCLREGLQQAPDDLKSIRPVWSPTREISDAARADSFSKIASVSPEFAQTEVGWRYAGFDQKDIDSILTTVRRNQASSTLDKLLGAAHDNESGREPSQSGTATGGQNGSQRDGQTVGESEEYQP